MSLSREGRRAQASQGGVFTSRHVKTPTRPRSAIASARPPSPQGGGKLVAGVCIHNRFNFQRAPLITQPYRRAPSTPIVSEARGGASYFFPRSCARERR